ncbi:MAG: cupin domain-containing protein, partial [Vicinamibacterales bacterium]
VDVLTLGSVSASRVTFEPGWKWSECIKPIAGTDSCQLRHVGMVERGSITVRGADGTEVVASAGSVYVIEPGHDAWVNGNEPVVAYEFDSHSAEKYAAK